jgi:hypothetical protein
MATTQAQNVRRGSQAVSGGGKRQLWRRTSPFRSEGGKVCNRRMPLKKSVLK